VEPDEGRVADEVYYGVDVLHLFFFLLLGARRYARTTEGSGVSDSNR
jgi:hypothetical protein